MATKLLVDKLIASGRFSEKDRLALNSLTDETATALTSVDDMSEVTPEQYLEAAPDHIKSKLQLQQNQQQNPQQVPPVEKATQPVPTMEQWLAAAPPAVRSVVQNAMTMEANEKEKLIAVITSNKANKFNPDWLKLQDLTMLQNMAEIAKSTANPNPPMYLGAGGPPMLNQQQMNNAIVPADLEPLPIPTMNFGTSEKQTSATGA